MNMVSPSVYREARRELALELEAVEAVLTAASKHERVVERIGPHGWERGFKLRLHQDTPDAPLSPIFFNFRTPDNGGPLTEELVETSAHCMRHIVYEKNLMFNGISAVPNAGDPFADALARLIGAPFIRLEKKTYGDKRRIESVKGTISPSIRKVLLVDDLITKADSKREAIDVLRSEGIEVADVIVLLDREQGGREELFQYGCALHSVYTITEVLDLYVGAGKMEPELRTRIKTYLSVA